MQVGLSIFTTPITLAVFMMLFSISCRKFSSKPMPYVVEVDDFKISDMGTRAAGYCGPTILMKNNENIYQVKYVPYTLPYDLQPNQQGNYEGLYNGKLRVYPEQLQCMDGMPDPMPGVSFYYHPEYVEIIAWERK